jgi:hypothetical protein
MVLTPYPETVGGERLRRGPAPEPHWCPDEPRWYSMYGCTVRSAVPLPLAPRPELEGDEPAWVFNRAEPGRPPPDPDGPLVARQRCEHGSVNVAISRGPGGTWFWHRALGTCHVSPDARRVDVYPAPGADEALLGLLLAGQVSTFILHRLGYPCLHASAVVVGDGAVAFLGPKGQGKSTMAAAFLRRGATLLTDDALPLEATDSGVFGSPGLAMMKLWPEAAEGTLATGTELPCLAANLEKRLLAIGGRFPFAETAARIRGIYVLDRYDPCAAGRNDCRVRTMGGREGLAALIAQTSAGSFLQPDEVAALLPLYARLAAQAPVRVLSYPSGFEHQAAVHAAVLADLEAG